LALRGVRRESEAESVPLQWAKDDKSGARKSNTDFFGCGGAPATQLATTRSHGRQSKGTTQMGRERRGRALSRHRLSSSRRRSSRGERRMSLRGDSFRTRAAGLASFLALGCGPATDIDRSRDPVFTRSPMSSGHRRRSQSVFPTIEVRIVPSQRSFCKRPAKTRRYRRRSAIVRAGRLDPATRPKKKPVVIQPDAIKQVLASQRQLAVEEFRVSRAAEGHDLQAERAHQPTGREDRCCDAAIAWVSRCRPGTSQHASKS
jgi:hypothetical protein